MTTPTPLQQAQSIAAIVSQQTGMTVTAVMVPNIGAPVYTNGVTHGYHGSAQLAANAALNHKPPTRVIPNGAALAAQAAAKAVAAKAAAQAAAQAAAIAAQTAPAPPVVTPSVPAPSVPAPSNRATSFSVSAPKGRTRRTKAQMALQNGPKQVTASFPAPANTPATAPANTPFVLPPPPAPPVPTPPAATGLTLNLPRVGNTSVMGYGAPVILPTPYVPATPIPATFGQTVAAKLSAIKQFLTAKGASKVVDDGTKITDVQFPYNSNMTVFDAMGFVDFTNLEILQ